MLDKCIGKWIIMQQSSSCAINFNS